MERVSRQITLVTKESLLSVNKHMIDTFGGLGHGISNVNQFESLVTGNYNQEVFGRELYPTIEDKIACIVHSIVCNHIFMDANKRTGGYVLKKLCVTYGVDISKISIVELMLELGNSKYTVSELSSILKGNKIKKVGAFS